MVPPLMSLLIVVVIIAAMLAVLFIILFGYRLQEVSDIAISMFTMTTYVTNGNDG